MILHISKRFENFLSFEFFSRYSVFRYFVTLLSNTQIFNSCFDLFMHVDINKIFTGI